MFGGGGGVLPCKICVMGFKPMRNIIMKPLSGSYFNGLVVVCIAVKEKMRYS